MKIRPNESVGVLLKKRMQDFDFSMSLEHICPGCGARLAFASLQPDEVLRCPECGELTELTETMELSDEMENNRKHQRGFLSASGGTLDSVVAGLAGIIIALACGCLAPAMLLANTLGLYVGIRSRGPGRKLAIGLNLLAILLELLVCWWWSP